MQQYFISLLVFLSLFIGGMVIIFGLLPHATPGARRAIRARAGKKDTLTKRLITQLSAKLQPYIRLDLVKREQLRKDLAALNRQSTPEAVHGEAMACGLLFSLAPLPFVPLFPVILLLCLALFVAGRQSVLKEIATELRERQKAIEWELPQLAGTIHQNLSYTRNVIDILKSYRKIAGPALRPEIDLTLNDMSTGNQEKAVERLAARVNSGSFTQLTQGIIGILRGDDQRAYFQMLALEYEKLQDELMRQELLKRPSKLTLNHVLMFVSLLLLFGVAIVQYAMEAGAALF